MALAFLSDIHGNLPALEAVLAEVETEGVADLVIGGDVIPGPLPAACLDRLLEWDGSVAFLHGNGEADLLGWHRGGGLPRVPERMHEALRWVAARLEPRHWNALASWPPTLRRRVEGLGDVVFCHATPRDDLEIFTRRSPEAALIPVFEPTGADLVVCGHTHMRADRTVGGRRVIVPGSVGLPFGEPGAYWAVLGPGGVDLRRTDYDRAAAEERFRASGYPAAADFRVVSPRTEGEMLDLFDPVTLGRGV